jgi:hypothetical protein
LAEIPRDLRFPPAAVVDYDDVFRELVRIKELNFPEHTVRDMADPYMQILALLASLGQHALGRMNHALLQFSPKTANSRQALIGLLEIVNRPLEPMSPAQGPVYARVKGTSYSAGDLLVEAGQRIAPPSTQDPMFSVDETVEFPTISTFHVSHHDVSDGELNALSAPYTASVSEGDSMVVEMDTLAFNSVALTFDTPFVDPAGIIVEHYNEEYGSVDSVSDEGALLVFVLDGYLWHDELSIQPRGLEVRIRHKPSGVAEDTTVILHAGSLKATTSFMGQASPSVSASDYEVLAEWRPVRGFVDNTVGFTTDAAIDVDFSKLMDEDVLWSKNASGRFALRFRVVDMGANSDPSNLVIDGATSDDNLWVVTSVSQGVRIVSNIGQTDGTTFQFMPVSSPPIREPVEDPAIVIKVGNDDEWFVVEDFSNSDSTSKHALFIEDPDDGWGILFGDGAVGQVPPEGDSVRVTMRTASVEAGDLAAFAEIRAIGGLGELDTWTLFRGTDGYAKREVDDRESALRFRKAVLPQLSLRAESVVTRTEIVTALTGGAPYRATFETEDGRRPFSRAFYTLEGAGDRQYRIVTVGSEADADGAVSSSDLTEAEEWLNGVEIGIEIIGGHGPNNTQAIVTQFVPRTLIPTITVTIANPNGVKDQVNQIVRSFFKPHARDSDQQFMFDMGGLVPLPILFGQLWAGIPGRVYIEISVTDGTDTYGSGDVVQLLEGELPTLDPTFDPTVNVIVRRPDEL